MKGYCNIEGRYKERPTILTSYVMSCNGPPVLGFRACKALGPIKVVYAVSSEKERTTQSDKILSEYTDVFKGISTFPGECSFTMDPEVGTSSLSITGTICTNRLSKNSQTTWREKA